MGGADSRDPGEPALTQGLSIASSLAEGSLLGTPTAYLGPRGQDHHPFESGATCSQGVPRDLSDPTDVGCTWGQYSHLNTQVLGFLCL